MSRDESERIRTQMARIRNDLTEDVGEVVDQARELTDWHNVVRRYPWLCVGAATALGFILVPSRPRIVSADGPAPANASTTPGAMGPARASMGPPQGSVLSPLMGTLANLVIRHAISVAGNQIQHLLTARTKSNSSPQ